MTNEKRDLTALKKFRRLTDYLAAAQIYLKENVFLEEELKPEHIKERLLGHWGTSPGINLIYAHLNRLIKKYQDRDFLFTVGPGHGFPAYQANILVEGSLSHFYPVKVPYTREGFRYVVRHFSVPYGFPSHLNPGAPGALLEGGELGYSLAFATGTIFDNPKLVNLVLIGDGEAETATLATSWNVNTFISPETDGAVLPVLHLNGYKISGPTIFGRMSDEELIQHFLSLGWDPHIVEGSLEDEDALHLRLVGALDTAMGRILDIQGSWKSGDAMPRWPMIILKTPKGMGAPKEVRGKKIEGNCDSHQVIFENPRENEEERKILESWLKSYRVGELLSFSESGKVLLDEDVISLIPPKHRRIGMSAYAHGDHTRLAQLPHFRDIAVSQEILKEEGESSMHEAGKYLRDLIRLGNDLRLFSPDETYSNKLHAIFEQTQRVWMRPRKAWDRDTGDSGRVVEMLSENVLFGMLWGYVLTGRYGYFATYEAFGQIVASMADQYVKFIKQAREVPFRKPVPALNVILSSLLERQDHNGFSHQNPSFIAENLDRDHDIVSVYFPADKNLMKLALEKTMRSRFKLNIIVAGKRMRRIWLSPEEAQKQADEEIMIWNWLSDDNPDIVVVTAGDYVTEEAVAGMKILREKMPHLRVRFVNLFSLDVFDEPKSIYSKEEILRRFLTPDKGIVFHYHGYPATIKKLLFDYDLADRIIVKGYQERGSTTSPFDMKARNELSRYHLVKHVARLAFHQGDLDEDGFLSIEREMNDLLLKERLYIQEHFVDPREIRDWA